MAREARRGPADGAVEQPVSIETFLARMIGRNGNVLGESICCVCRRNKLLVLWHPTKDLWLCLTCYFR